MKKTSLILFALMVSLFATAQTIEKTYYLGQPSVSQIQGYEQIQFTDCMQSALAGQPSLPWQSVSLMLPQGTEAVSIEVELSDFQTMEGSHNLFPYQSARTYSDPVRRQFEKDEALYASKSVYPAQAYGKLSTQYLNGIGFAFSAFTPVQYVPGTGEVRYATKATVRVTTAASKADQSRKLWLNGGNAERRNTVTLAHIDRLGQVADRAAFVIGIADRDHDGEERHVQADRFFDIFERLVVEARENRRAGVETERNRLVRRRRNDAAENTARAHNAVGVFEKRIDRQIDAFQTGRRAHNEAVVKRQHDGMPGLRVENLGKTGFNTVTSVFVALEEEAFLLLRNANAKIFCVDVAFVVSHRLNFLFYID